MSTASDSALEGEGGPVVHEGHGWWPYLVPYLVFVVMTEFGPRLGEAAQPWLLAIKPAFGLGLVLITYLQQRPDSAQAGLDQFLFGLSDGILPLALVILSVGVLLFDGILLLSLERLNPGVELRCTLDF